MGVEETLNEIAWRARKHMPKLRDLDDITDHEKIEGLCSDAATEVLRLSRQPKFADLDGEFSAYILTLAEPTGNYHTYHNIVVYEEGLEQSFVIDVTKAQFPELHAQTNSQYVVPYGEYPWRIVEKRIEDTKRRLSHKSHKDIWTIRTLLESLVADVQEKLVKGIENGILEPYRPGEENKKDFRGRWKFNGLCQDGVQYLCEIADEWYHELLDNLRTKSAIVETSEGKEVKHVLGVYDYSDKLTAFIDPTVCQFNLERRGVFDFNLKYPVKIELLGDCTEEFMDNKPPVSEHDAFCLQDMQRHGLRS